MAGIVSHYTALPNRGVVALPFEKGKVAFEHPCTNFLGLSAKNLKFWTDS